MAPLTYICFYLAVAAYLVAGAAVVGYIRGQRAERLLVFAQWATALASALLVTTLVLRFLRWQLFPLSTSVDALSLFVLLSACTALFVSRGERRALLAIYLLPLAGLAIATGISGVSGLNERPKELTGALLLTHVGLVFFAFSLFFVASLTSFAYLDQARRLKRHAAGALFAKLPSLENLDRTLYRLIQIGYPVFVVALGLGMYWAWYENELLSSAWWMSPKVILSILMGAVYSICFHARRRGWLRGPKLATFVFVGVGLVLGVFVLLRVLELTNVNFYVDKVAG
jgi:ABC-type uncharacterized transport system permease subunit